MEKIKIPKKDKWKFVAILLALGLIVCLLALSYPRLDSYLAKIYGDKAIKNLIREIDIRQGSGLRWEIGGEVLRCNLEKYIPPEYR